MRQSPVTVPSVHLRLAATQYGPHPGGREKSVVSAGTQFVAKGDRLLQMPSLCILLSPFGYLRCSGFNCGGFPKSARSPRQTMMRQASISAPSLQLMPQAFEDRHHVSTADKRAIFQSYCRLVFGNDAVDDYRLALGKVTAAHHDATVVLHISGKPSNRSCRSLSSRASSNW